MPVWINLRLKNRSQLAVIELVFAGALWGFGFVASVWALEAMEPMTVTAYRFVLALLVGGAIVFSIPNLHRQVSFATLKLSCFPGFLLGITIVLQTWGLKYTTATKSGFLTCLYVLMVPIFERVLLKTRLPRHHFLFVVAALFGVALICDLAGALSGSLDHDAATALTSASPSTDILRAKLHWNVGDLLTVLCAVTSSVHILYFGMIAKKIENSFIFNLSQTFWAAIIPVFFALAFETPPTFQRLLGPPLIGLCALALGATLIAFSLQIRAQKEISPSLASLLFLLESPYATLFAIYLLGEHLRTHQWAGAGLILTAVLMSTLFSAEKAEIEATVASAGPADANEAASI